MYVFTYGTLKKGFPNHYWMEDIDAKLVGEGKTEQIFDMVSVNDRFPGLVKGNYAITGEVYKIQPADIEHLDVLEGYPDLYDRKKIKVNVGGKTLTAIVYVLNIDEKFPTDSTKIEQLSDGSLNWI